MQTGLKDLALPSALYLLKFCYKIACFRPCCSVIQRLSLMKGKIVIHQNVARSYNA